MAQPVTKLRRVQKDDKIKMNFDMSTLNMIIKFILSPTYNTRADIINIKKLFDKIDLSLFEYDQKVMDRINLLRLMCNAITVERVDDFDIIRSYCVTTMPELQDLCNEISWQKDQIGKKECKYIAGAISERLQYLFLYEYRTKLVDGMDELNQTSFFSYANIVKETKKTLSALMSELQQAQLSNGRVTRLNFADDAFHDTMDIILRNAKKPTSVLQCGMRQMNAILDGGFHSGELYLYLGLSGRFKSGTLLNLADQIRLFNPQIKPVENGLRKCILFITLENSIENNIERLVSMYEEEDLRLKDFQNVEEVIDLLRKKGRYTYDEDDGITIEFVYYDNLEISCNDIYIMIQDLEDRGFECISVFLDYLKKLDSVHDARGEERLRLEYASGELQTLAKSMNIPVVTVMQINRTGNAIIDAAARDEKEDLLKFIGNSDIGGAWAINENASFVALVNIERQKSSGKLFLSVKRTKMRGNADKLVADYFNHPFVNSKEIRLETDMDKPYSVSIKSLASDLESVNTEDYPYAKMRPIMENKPEEKEKDILSAITINSANLQRLA